MTTGSQSGIQLAGLFSAAALYAGILGYLQFHGAESLDSARHGIAVNAQLQKDLEARTSQSAEASKAENTNGSAHRDDEIVRPLSSGIFASADGGAVTPAADQAEADSSVAADTGPVAAAPQRAAPVAAATATAPEAQPWPAAVPAAYGAYAAPVTYNAYAVDDGYAPAWQGQGYGNSLGDGYGQGRGRGHGRGNWDGDGEFSFSMRFVSRLRGDADIDADSDWNADSAARVWQDARQRQWWQSGQAARYASWNR